MTERGTIPTTHHELAETFSSFGHVEASLGFDKLVVEGACEEAGASSNN